jgi:hypothetical protein
MAVMPRSLCWQRVDSTGIEHVLFDDRSGLYARGTIVGTDPLTYSGSYELLADQKWASARLTVNVEGAGWLRSLKLERAAGRWHATAGEQGDLDAALMHEGHTRAQLPGVENPDRLATALDVDLGYSPLTNTLPIRRLGLRAAATGTQQTVAVAWVLVPSLVVVPAQQTYTVVGLGTIRYSSGDFSAELTVDGDGFVTHYPGLAKLVTA